MICKSYIGYSRLMCKADCPAKPLYASLPPTEHRETQGSLKRHCLRKRLRFPGTEMHTGPQQPWILTWKKNLWCIPLKAARPGQLHDSSEQKAVWNRSAMPGKTARKAVVLPLLLPRQLENVFKNASIPTRRL